MVKWTCEQCGAFDIDMPDGVPIRCPHSDGAHFTPRETPLVFCAHLGPEVSPLSCGCGSAHHCKLHDITCVPGHVVDEFVTLVTLKKELRDIPHRKCQECGDRRS